MFLGLVGSFYHFLWSSFLLFNATHFCNSYIILLFTMMILNEWLHVLVLDCCSSILTFFGGQNLKIFLLFTSLPSVRLFKGTASNTIVLTGLSGSGKTYLFYQVTLWHVTYIIFSKLNCSDLDVLAYTSLEMVQPIRVPWRQWNQMKAVLYYTLKKTR